MNFGAFTPSEASSSINVTTGAPTVKLAGTGNVLRVVNAGATECFFITGDSNVAAIPDDNLSLPAASVTFVAVPPDHTHASAVTNSDTTTIRIARGSLG